MPRHPVASGTYAISGRKDGIMNAYLGSCVGVVLVDRKAEVGGLIHLLLPEPTGDGAFGNPENYAVTGLPLFLSALCSHGAKIERLEATIAGGAFVDPLSEMDVTLDIGGRTVEIVEKILRQMKIPTVKSETGGFFSCQLCLNLKTWKSHIEPVSVLAPAQDMNFNKPDPAQLEAVMERVSSVPQIVLKIVRMIRDDNRTLQDMAEEIRKDQVITAKVLKLCNSAFFSKKLNVDSIDRALVLLGEKQLLQLVVSAVFRDFFSLNNQGYSLCKGGLFNHALGTALISERLANLNGSVSGDIAYTAGLLHDIGKVVLDQYIGRAQPYFYRKIQDDCENLLTIEQEVFGITHNEVGTMLGRRWGLPEDLLDAIRHHHHPEESSGFSQLTHLVYLADLLMSRFLTGQELDCLSADNLDNRLKKIGFTINQFPRIIDSIPRQVFQFPFESLTFGLP